MSSLWSQLCSGSWPRVHSLLHARLLPIGVRHLREEARAAVKACSGDDPLQFMRSDYSVSDGSELARSEVARPTEA
jgi:hypothetical protein